MQNRMPCWEHIILRRMTKRNYRTAEKAEENGVDFNAINQKAEVNSDGSCTLTVQIENFMQEENGKNPL